MYKYCWIHPVLCILLLALGWAGTEAGGATVSRQGKKAELGEIQIIAIFAIFLTRIYKKLGTTDLSRRCPGDWALGYN